jgi:transposase
MVVVEDHQEWEPSMNEITTIGLDLAKNVFEVHGVDATGVAVLRKRVRRGQVLAFFAGLPCCLVGIEACATAHYWARELRALGHEVRLMPPQYVKAYVKRNKNDAADAAAICEAVQRPSMRFVAVKTAEQQSALLMHRVRELLVRQRTMLANALRGHMAEFGFVTAQGLHNVARLVAIVRDDKDEHVPDMARQVLRVIADQLDDLETRIAAIETQIMAWHKTNPVSQRLATIPSNGPIIATAMAATVAEPGVFRSSREFAAWAGSRAAAELHRRQGTPRRDQQTRRQLSQAPVSQRRPCSAAALQGGQVRSLVSISAHPKTPLDRGCRPGEQDSTHCLGDHEQGRYLPTCHSGSLGRRAAVRSEACERKDARWQIGRPTDRENL